MTAHAPARPAERPPNPESDPPPRRRFALLPERLARFRRPRWWEEAIFIAVCYYAYSLVRNGVPEHEVAAKHRAKAVLHVESWLHVDVERSVNHFVDSQHWLANIADYYYSILHFVVTIAVLVWIYRKHPLQYRSVRSVLFATNVAALFGFWFYALAPPRLLPGGGFVDTVVKFHTWGSWGSSGVDSASNQFAAMPSLHIGWSLWAGISLVMLARRRWLRVLGALYPVATLLVILGTANHFVLDAVGGVAALGIGFGVQRLLSGRPAFADPRPHLQAAATSGVDPAAA